MSQLKIAYLIRAFNRGGAEILLREMFENETFKNIPGEKELIILDKKRLELLKDIKDVKYFTFNIFSKSFIQEYYKLFKLLKQKKYNIIHAHLPNAGIVIRLIKPFLHSFKLIYSEHSLITGHNKITFLLNGLTYSLNNYVVFVSGEVKNAIDKFSKGKFYKYNRGKVIDNGVNSDKFYCVGKTENVNKTFITVGTLASLRYMKRLDRWVEVVQEILKNNSQLPIKFVIAGDGPEKPKIEKLIAERQLKQHIRLPGLIVDTVSVYNDIDIFLMTSDFEGLPIALLEAMSCSCVPVVSNVGGIKQLLFKNFGYKYDVFNPVEIAHIIVKYSNNIQQLLIEQKLAREFVIENYSLNKQVQNFVSLYNSL